MRRLFSAQPMRRIPLWRLSALCGVLSVSLSGCGIEEFEMCEVYGNCAPEVESCELYGNCGGFESCETYGNCAPKFKSCELYGNCREGNIYHTGPKDSRQKDTPEEPSRSAPKDNPPPKKKRGDEGDSGSSE